MPKDLKELLNYIKLSLLMLPVLIIMLLFAQCAPAPEPSNYQNPDELMNGGSNE